MALGLALLMVAGAYANEGADQYPNGAENWLVGAAPPPGLYYVNYFGYYAGQMKNGSGNNVRQNGGVPAVQAVFNGFRLVEFTRFKILGADYGMHVIVPVVYQSMNLNGRNSATGLGDITVDPFVLGWHGSRWHAVAAFDVNLPTGSYDRSDPRLCISAHYYSFEPLFAFSFLPKSGWELSAKLMYNLKTTNPVTNYHSGQDFHMDYVAGKHVGNWMFGASGYALEQTTDDTVNGATVPALPGWWSAGRRGQVLAVGPSAGYTNQRHMTFIVQWQHETLVANRFGGNKAWVKMVIPTAGLFGGSKH